MFLSAFSAFFATSAVFSYGVTTGRSMKLAWPGA